MNLLALAAAASLVLALLAGASGVLTPAAAAHLAFAAGAVPLIFAAVLHFVPVLTRSSGPSPTLRRLPWVALLLGLLIACAIAGELPGAFLHAAALANAAIALTLIFWMRRRAGRALGTPHPGWRWYAAALAALAGAMLAVPPLAAGVAPLPLRLFHLHLNTSGFITLAALGTLPVLLPTALGKADSLAAPWLRRRLWPAAAAALALALGSALFAPLAALGALLLFALIASLLVQWWRGFGWRALASDGAAAPLCGALLFLAVLQLNGLAHGLFAADGNRSIAAFAAGFLFPLISGALSQLLPVWRWPGPKIPARDEMRRRLVRLGGWRALLFFLAGGSFLVGLAAAGAALAGGGLLFFAVDLAGALRVSREPR